MNRYASDRSKKKYYVSTYAYDKIQKKRWICIYDIQDETERLRRMRSIDALLVQFTCTNTMRMYTDTWVIRRWPGETKRIYFEYASYYSQSQQWAFLIQPCMCVYTSIDFEWINVYKRIYIYISIFINIHRMSSWA